MFFPFPSRLSALLLTILPCAFLGLVGCTSTSDVALHGEHKMVASYYGGRWDGRKTASGEIFDEESMTAAHKTLPLGTILEVTNPQNGKTIKVTVNNRGPYIRGRDLDLSYGAAKRLDFVRSGVTPLKVRQVGHDSRYDRYLKNGSL